MSDWQRTHTCGELRPEHVGQQATLNGWVDARRDLGGIYFLELRDRHGKTQVVLSEEVVGDLHIGTENCLSVSGEVVARDEQNINHDRPTGEIELVVTTLRKLSDSKVPPFETV